MTLPIQTMAVVILAAPTLAGAADWPATQAGRAAARDALSRLETALDATDSASEALRRWCVDNRLADPPVIHADRVRDLDKPAGPDVRRALGVGPDEPLRYRRVRLRCGDRVLSEADNWYRPNRLTAAMNQTLDQTDRPFGVVVATLGFHRRTLGVESLFDPMTAQGEAPAGRLTAPHAVLRHRAVLVTADGAPFSLVVETYTDAALASPP